MGLILFFIPSPNLRSLASIGGIEIFFTTVRPGTQPDRLVVQVILGFSGGLYGLTCADWM